MISISLLLWIDDIIVFVKITFQVLSDIMCLVVIIVSVLTEHIQMDGEKWLSCILNGFQSVLSSGDIGMD
jgi:hypothetical protein